MNKNLHKYYYTYKITLLCGSLQNHYYYGQHSTDNIDDGYAGSGTILNRYYKKYEAIEGVTYIKEILHFYNSIDELNEAEFDLIGDKYENDEQCLNLRAGGGRSGYSEETLQKMSTALKNRKVSEKTRLKLSQALKGRSPWNKGKHLSEENIQKLKKPKSEETKRKLSQALKGHIISEETKLKISQSLKGKNKGHYHSEETKKLISEKKKGNKYCLGRILSEEAKRKISEKSKGRLKGKHWKLIDGKRIYY